MRKTCLRYGLPDPLQILLYPWRPDRWRQHCKEKIISFWENYLKENLSTSQQAALVDVDNLSLSKPLQLWEEAGLDSQDVLKTTIASWMLLGVYQTKQKLKDMNMAKSAECPGCHQNQIETLDHLLFKCPTSKRVGKPTGHSVGG